MAADPLPTTASPPGPEYGNTPEKSSEAAQQKPRAGRKPAVLPEIYENRPSADAATDSSSQIRTVPMEAVESLQSALDELSAKVNGLERKRSLGGSGTNLTEVLPRLEKAVSATERLERNVKSLQQELAEVRERMEAIAGQVERDRGGGSNKTGKDNGGEVGEVGEDGEGNKNPELAVLDCGEVKGWDMRGEGGRRCLGQRVS